MIYLSPQSSKISFLLNVDKLADIGEFAIDNYMILLFVSQLLIVNFRLDKFKNLVIKSNF